MSSLEEQIINEMDVFLGKVASKLQEDAQLRGQIAEEMKRWHSNVQKT